MTIKENLESGIGNTCSIYIVEIKDGHGNLNLTQKSLKKVRGLYTSKLGHKFVTRNRRVEKYKNLIRYSTTKRSDVIEEEDRGTFYENGVLIGFSSRKLVPETRMPLIGQKGYQDEYEEDIMSFKITDDIRLDVVEETRGEDKTRYVVLRVDPLIKEDIPLVMTHINHLSSILKN